ncbi:hypothetical protein M9980_01415 [Sphingomonas donggukensis]|uniref:Integrase n=1 Tax=Sphingomonas donggukensis TaxID=2949093 RepID=A0ABY4TU47_9SPHN|nr:hypothetical protein [Sphingomonas donggukensis]URW75917.1 hypothetical protein M9980_01415 [Sphingomonas donggukensis]
MTDEFSLARSEKLTALYTRYRETLDSIAVGGRWMPYRWWTLPDRLNAEWMAYSQMLGEYASELANIINDLTHHVHRLRAWDQIVATLDDNDKHEASHEFIEMLGTVAMGQPYAIKSRFAFAAGHLSHQANQAIDGSGWNDDFPSFNLYLNDIEPYCSQWKRYRAFKLKVEPIAGKKFKRASDDFRNAYNHGFSSRFLVGMTGVVKRIAKGGAVSYAFGGNEPLGTGEIADLLEVERDHCYAAFDAFQRLVEEQVAAIVAVEGGGTPVSGGRAPEPPRSGDLLQFNPESGTILFEGRKVGSTEYANGATRVAFSIEYEAVDGDWVVPLSWLAYGLRLAGLDRRPAIVFEASTDADDIEPVAASGPILLVEKTLRLDGYVWQFHKSDADPWPSPLHGHDYERGLVIDGITGQIYDKATGTEVFKLKRKPLEELHQQIRASKDLATIAAQHLPPPQP